MLRIGLTGGIGAGKSTVSAAFNECGGIIVDGDVIAREVVEPGTQGLSALVDTFGVDILLPDGALNRPALAAKAFVDDEQRAKLNGIVHPLVGKRREEIIAAVSDDAVVVEDIPLLVETGMAPMFPLVVVVHADQETDTPELRLEDLIVEITRRRPFRLGNIGMRLTMAADDSFGADKDGRIKVNAILVDFGHSDDDVAIVLTRECCEAVRARAGDSLDKGRDFFPVAPAIAGRSHFRGYDQLRACLSRSLAEFEKLRHVAVLLEQSRFELNRCDDVRLRHGRQSIKEGTTS